MAYVGLAVAEAHYDRDAHVAVTAHLILNWVAIMVGSAAALRDGWATMADDERAGFLTSIELRGAAVAQALWPLASGEAARGC